MKYTIVPDDQTVGVDDVFLPVVYVMADPTINAIHWDNLEGVLEFRVVEGKDDEVINDFSPYQYIIDAYDLVAQAIAVEIAAEIAQDIAEDIAEDVALALEIANRTPIQNRMFNYPQLNEQLYALYQDRAGDPAPLIANDALCAAVDLLYPL
jgi:hypothetical protein